MFTQRTGDVRVRAGDNTLWDAVINRRQKRVDVQGGASGKVPLCRAADGRELASGADSPYRDTSHWLTITHTGRDHRLERSCSGTDLLPSRAGNCAQILGGGLFV